MNIWLLKYLMKLLGSKLYILNTFNLWAFDVSLPLCYDVGDYLVFMTMSLWHVINPLSLWRRLCDMWLSYLRDDKPGWKLPLCMKRANPRVCGSCYPLGQKTICKRGTVWHVIPCCPWGEKVNPWGCGWGQAGPRDHMQ